MYQELQPGALERPPSRAEFVSLRGPGALREQECRSRLARRVWTT
jgi:hypothetical protein